MWTDTDRGPQWLVKTSEEVREEQRKQDEIQSKSIAQSKKYKDGNFQLHHHVNRVSTDAESASDVFAFFVRQKTTIHIVINNKK